MSLSRRQFSHFWISTLQRLWISVQNFCNCVGYQLSKDCGYPCRTSEIALVEHGVSEAKIVATGNSFFFPSFARDLAGIKPSKLGWSLRCYLSGFPLWQWSSGLCRALWRIHLITITLTSRIWFLWCFGFVWLFRLSCNGVLRKVGLALVLIFGRPFGNRSPLSQDPQEQHFTDWFI